MSRNIVAELNQLTKRISYIEEFIGAAPVSQTHLLEQFRFLEGDHNCAKENYDKLFQNVLLQLNYLEAEIKRLKHKLNEVILYL